MITIRRLPLGLQIPFGVIMFAGLATFMPNSPRQLIRAGKVEEARREYGRTWRGVKGDGDVERERERGFEHVKNQIEFEMEREIKDYREIWRLFRRRVLV